MSQMRLSPATKALLSEAKADAPSATSRANVWSEVARTVGAMAGGSSVASAAGGTGTKALLLGTFFGATATVGLALALLRFGSAPVLPHAEASVAIAPAAPVRAASVAAPGPLPGSGPIQGWSTGAAARDLAATETHPSQRASQRDTVAVGLAPVAGLPPCRHSPRKSSAALAGDDPLAYEASLIGEARSALARGDAQSALRAIRAAGALPSRQLVPEELAVEARALRSLGRSAEAKDVGDMLKERYPESALAR